ncbi:MAG: N-acetylmuramoyl-L-alanine amidase [Desulfobacula sp.]|nr:N-acetylmuramoyl-L-alanine amidase [Desulfobacula sp.]
MITACNFAPGRWVYFWLILFCLQSILPPLSQGYSRSQYQKFQKVIIDHRSCLNPGFKKIKRLKTRYIIVHTSELGLTATLRVVSKGKQFKSGYKTPGGHANYVIARNGRAYRVLDKKYRADHAGRSMWNGQTDISKVSVGIELVGYHDAPLTSHQYQSVGLLIQILKKAYGLKDRDVLTHSQVAYGRPNPWFKKNHRGRKRCAKNFVRSKAGLSDAWGYDPDVRAGRLMADPLLAEVFYDIGDAPEVLADTRVYGSNIVSKTNSAWSIAGGDYNSRTTVYILPGGQMLFGDQVHKKNGWDRLPVNTKVLVNQELALGIQAQSPIKIISNTMTAWSHAGIAYKEDTTIYFLPQGQIFPGSEISDWDDLPLKTRLLVGYKGPFQVTKTQTAYKIAGRKYKNPETVYFLPPERLIAGDKMNDFSVLPLGTQVFLPQASH